MAGTSGSEVKLCQPASSQSKIAQTRSLSFGSRKTCDPLQPCCFRFSAPLVEKVFQKRSKSPIFAVARTMSPPLSERVVVPSPYATPKDEMGTRLVHGLDHPDPVDAALVGF